MSLWLGQEITVDGSDSDWEQNQLIYFNDHSVAVGIKNDAEHVYFLFRTTDRATKHTLMRRGLTIWFNADGKKRKTFGIRYPIGLGTYQQLRPYDPDEWRMNEHERLEMHMTEMLNEMVIIGPGENTRNHTFVKNPYGISLALTDTANVLIYELKVPLQSSGGHPYLIHAEPGNTIRVGLESGSMEGQMIRRSGSGQGGMAGAQGGAIRSRSQPGGSRQIATAPLEIWLQLHLASEN